MQFRNNAKGAPMRWEILLLALLVVSQVAFAQTLYVTPDGDDTADLKNSRKTCRHLLFLPKPCATITLL